MKAEEMQLDDIYKTNFPGKRESYFVLLEKNDPLEDTVKVRAYFSHLGWTGCDIGRDYPVRVLTEEEMQVSAKIAGRTGRTITMKSERKSKNVGVVSGLKMMEAWGHWFEKYVREVGGRELIIKAMEEDFPQKAESASKWVNSYKSYFNAGKLPGCKKQEVPLNWVKKVTGDPVADADN